MGMGSTMISTRYAISWVYGEFKIVRMQNGEAIQSWTSDFIIKDLESLCKAMSEAAKHVDLNHGGDLAIAYEDDNHTHDFLAVPNMNKKDLEKLLNRKVSQNKPFEEDAAWCYHEAQHESEDEGIMLHLLPQQIVDSTIRICQEFYLTPKRLVPLTEVISELVPTYDQDPNHVLIAVALFKERTEIVITMGSGEILFVRELSYSSDEENLPRLITDINRTIRYSKQRFGVIVNSTWLIGEQSDEVYQKISTEIESSLQFDPKSAAPYFWATSVASIQGQTSANFIPLLARKRINRTLFYRIALWIFGITVISAITINSSTEYALAKQAINPQKIQASIVTIQQEISHIEDLVQQAEKSKKELLVLQADAQNLPALFASYLGDFVPEGLIITQSDVQKSNNQWLVTIKGTSSLNITDMVPLLTKLETNLTSSPWNMTINKSWQVSWYEQLKQGAATKSGELGFEFSGWIM